MKKLTEREAAVWLLGHHAAMHDKVPHWHAINRAARAEYLNAVRTAAEIMDGGAFNPLCVWAMLRVVDTGLRESIERGT